MPRKDILHDLNACRDIIIPNVFDIRQGSDSNLIDFTYASDALPEGIINLQILIPETHDYPTSHQCILLVDNNENVFSTVISILERVQDASLGKRLPVVIAEVSRGLDEELSRGTRSHSVCLSADHGDVEAEAPLASDPDPDDFDAANDEFDDDDDYDYDDIFFPDAKKHDQYSARATTTKMPTRHTKFSDASTHRIRSDLQAAKNAGFKIGILGDPCAGGVVCVSIRVVKLGISEEAMQAWNLQRHHHLVLMIKFDAGYQSLEEVSRSSSLGGQTDMRVVLCNHYKPNQLEAFQAFAEAKVSNRRNPGDTSVTAVASRPGDVPKDNTVETMFISGPLNSLLRERLPFILRHRLSTSASWMGAEMCFNDSQGASSDASDVMGCKYYQTEPGNTRVLQPIVTADAMADGVLSLPLISMQFLLRHFVRCTDFCLVCHCKVDATFEALRPYVCSKPLCLYQYINLGFGPSIEWEILTQPYVVDLLVSFCYASAASGRLKDFPTGLDLNVPMMEHLADTTRLGTVKPTFSARWGPVPEELDFDKEVYPQTPVKVGAYVVLRSKSNDGFIHTRVEETSYWPRVILRKAYAITKKHTSYDHNTGVHQPNYPKDNNSDKALSPFAAGAVVEGFAYDTAFDQMSDREKRSCIPLLLDTIPSVTAMQSILQSAEYGKHPTLRGSISEPALNLLRWIIASNRSCIMQAQATLPKHLGTGQSKLPRSVVDAEHHVPGMKGWVQFRFAQGAPDKEQRFIDSVKSVCTGLQYPTFFAWHGSPLTNWHGIVRQGLYFKDVLHGRAYGDGVYMSPHASTSLGYSGTPGYSSSGCVGRSVWPNSVMKISQAISLQEVVNKPDQFRSRSPHYVVQQLDWIQTRYLFVKGQDSSEIITENTLGTATKFYDQDPNACVYDEKGVPLNVPITAISKSRRPVQVTGSQQQSQFKKSKGLTWSNEQTAQDKEDDANSIISDTEDREYLMKSPDGDVEMPDYIAPPKASTSTRKRSLQHIQDSSQTCQHPSSNPEGKTDFVPGTLDTSKFPMPQAPKNASVPTTKALMKAFKETLKVQDATPAHELGWYIDRDLVGNMYQWIVELHSFESTLPLAQDMKIAGLTSVVLELRFTNSFPFSPPFARVIRPRFLPFQSGGGGHVTAGGAICMELLTNNGWLVTNTIESVLLQIRMAMSSLDPRPARLEQRRHFIDANSCYGVGEAIEAYKRACQVHGWQIPADFNTLQR